VPPRRHPVFSLNASYRERKPPVRNATTASTMAMTRTIQISAAARWNTPVRPKSHAMIKIATKTQSRLPMMPSFCWLRHARKDVRADTAFACRYSHVQKAKIVSVT